MFHVMGELEIQPVSEVDMVSSGSRSGFLQFFGCSQPLFNVGCGMAANNQVN